MYGISKLQMFQPVKICTSADKKSIRIFAGCGIVAGSIPSEELAESQAKLSPMRTALEALA